MVKCGYCGRENEDETQQCLGCGSGLAFREETPERRKKSKIVASILAFIFGPLGLLYLGIEGLMVMLFVAGVGFFVAPMVLGKISGLTISFFGRVACVIYAINAIDKEGVNKTPRDEAIEELNEAARLENVDCHQAIAKYEEIKAKLPNSAASEEAERAIKSLTKAMTSSIT